MAEGVDPGLLKLDPYSYLNVVPDYPEDDEPAPASDPPNPEARDVPAPANTARAKATSSAAADAAACDLSPQPLGSTSQPCPLHAKEWLVVRVVGEGDTPMPDIPVKLTKSDGEILAMTRADGVVVFSGLEKGSYGIALPNHDSSAWSFGSSGAPAVTPPTPAGPATFYAPSGPATADGHHTVAAGECMTSIAAAYGWAPQDLWDHSGNAALKEKRGHLRTLVEGDDVFIPACRPQSGQKPTGQQHTIELKGVPAFLKLLVQSDGKPRKNEPYLVDLGSSTIAGQTDGDGNISVPIVPGTRTAILLVGPSAAPDRYELHFGELEPAATARGLQQRLRNLGYLAAIDDPDDAAVATALAAFQKDAGLKPTGAMDPDTQARLEKSYGDT